VVRRRDETRGSVIDFRCGERVGGGRLVVDCILRYYFMGMIWYRFPLQCCWCNVIVRLFDCMISISKTRKERNRIKQYNYIRLTVFVKSMYHWVYQHSSPFSQAMLHFFDIEQWHRLLARTH